MTYHFESWSQNTEFSEADVEGRTGEATIWLLYHNDINGTCQCCTVDFIVKLPKVGNKLADIVHRIHGDCYLYHVLSDRLIN